MKTENEKDMEGIEKFLNRHMMKSHPPEYAYQYCVLLYYEYLAEGLKEARKIEDGEVFDEFYNAALFHELKNAQECVQEMKKILKYKTPLYDISEQLAFPGGRLKAGIFTGDPSDAVQAARNWISSNFKRMRNPFLFETGVYILTLLNENIEIEGWR